MKQLTRRFFSSPEILLLAIILVLATFIRLSAIVLYAHSPESDELAYLKMARTFLTEEYMSDNTGNYAMYNMGYPVFVLAPIFALFGENLVLMKVANATLGVLSTYLCYIIAKEAGAGKGGRLLAAAAWAFYLPSSVFTVYAFKENLLIPLMLGVSWYMLRFLKGASTLLAIGCGILFGLVALSGNAGMALALPVGLALLHSRESIKRNYRFVPLLVFASLLVISPWLVRNMNVIGAPVLNSNGGFNFYLGNNEKATGNFVSILDTPLGKGWKALEKRTGEVYRAEMLKHEAEKWILANPDKFALLAVKKLGMFWAPPLHDGKYKPSTVERIVRSLWGVQFIVLMACAGGTLFFYRQLSMPDVLLWGAVCAYSMLHMLFYVMPRYREPIMPLICILAAIFAERVLSSWRTSVQPDDSPPVPATQPVAVDEHGINNANVNTEAA